MPRVLIIGAGVAGITAASALHAASMEVYILEASNRIGGRVYTIQPGVELGATWIHGTVNNPIYDVSVSKGIIRPQEKQTESLNPNEEELSSWRLTEHPFIMEGGKQVEPNIVKKALKVFSKYRNELFRWPKLKLDSRVYNDSVEEYFQQRWKNEHVDKNKVSNIEERLVFNWRKYLECSISACSTLKDLSLQYLHEYCELPGENVEVTAGFSKIVEALFAGFPSSHIFFGREVVHIQWGNGEGNDRVVVKCKNGEVFSAEYLLWTGSLGVLQERESNMFEPSLPEKKREAIHRLALGTVDKVFVEFDESPLQYQGKEWDYVSLLWYEGLEKDEPSHWTRKVFSLRAVDKMLSFWVTGESARQLEKESDEDILRQVTELLSCFGLKPLKGRRLLRSNWYSDPFFRGSYSFVPAHASGEDFEVVAEPVVRGSLTQVQNNQVQNPCLLFAGEATHRYFYSTTHGAYLSGIREAKRILESQGLKKQHKT
eukprot:jgi/Galph1/639/GphlegSOOS_G5429.1